jgi:hypothetical protein
MEHSLRSSTKIVSMASRSTNLVNLDSVDVDCLANFWWSGAENGDFEVVESLTDRL